MKRRIGSVRFRITAAVTLLFAITLVTSGVFFVHHLQQTLVSDVQDSDIKALQELWSHYQQGTSLSSVLTAPQSRPGLQVQVLDKNGDIVAATPGAAQRPLDPRFGPPLVVPPIGPGGGGPGQPPDLGVVPCGPRVGLPLDKCFGTNNETVPAPLPAPLPANLPVELATRSVVPNSADSAGAKPGDLAVTALPITTSKGRVNLVAASSLTDVQQSVDALARSLKFAIPILVMLIGGSAWLMTGRALRPVEAITSRVEDITASTLHERVPVPGARDEIAHLANTMNAMLERLESAAARQRQFVSDASHELRSPVSSIRTEIEVAMLHPDTADWFDIGRNVLAEDERLERIVADLLLLARLDEQLAVAATQGIETVKLDDVVRSEAQRTRRVAVAVSAVNPVNVTGRYEEMCRLVGHLLDNAARHAAGVVSVSLDLVEASSGLCARLVVDDDGPGIPIDGRDAIFERFGRLEEGRSRDGGGAGLGLAVVKRIVERHRGVVRVTDGPLGGARFEIDIPATIPESDNVLPH